MNSTRSDRLTAIAFSKDRPLQLEAMLHSLGQTCEDIDVLDFQVLFKASSRDFAQCYEQVAAEHTWAKLVHEYSFKKQLLECTENSRFILFLVDDTIFTKPFSAATAAALLEEKPDALGFSFRLGRNTQYCYTLASPQRLPELRELGDGPLEFRWHGAECDFGYPLEVSSSLYRKDDVWPLLASLKYRNPNTLESVLSGQVARFEREKPNLLCMKRSVAFSNPINLVQKTFANRAGGNPEYSSESLLRQFMDGYRVDVTKLLGFSATGCHQVVDLPFVQTEKRVEGAGPVQTVWKRLFGWLKRAG